MPASGQSGALSLAPVVQLDGNSLSALWLGQLLEVRVERQFGVPGRVTLRFSDPGYALSDSETASMGTELVVFDADGSTELISAEITDIGVEQRSGEQPELVLVGYDRSHRLGRSTTVQTFAQIAYSDVVSQLASAAGLTASTDSTGQQFDYIMQADTGLGMLSELARRVGFDWWAESSTLYFKKPVEHDPVVSFTPQDVRSLSVKASGHAPDSYQVEGWDRAQQELVMSTSTSTDVPASVLATSGMATKAASRSSKLGSGEFTTAGLGAHTSGEAKTVSDALMARASASSVSIQGVVDGTGLLAPGAWVEVTGAGTTVSGKYPVTRVEHTLRAGSGYLTRFWGGERTPTSMVDTLNSGRLDANPTHQHPGLVVGMVTNIDQSSGQVKVRYPGLSNQYETGWARVVAVGGGANRGGVFIPEVNDEVLVAFEGGDPRQPVVIGGLYGAKSTLPSSTTIADGTVQSRGLTSRLGHGVQLLDGTDPAKQAVELSLAGGEHIVHMGKDKMTVTVPSGYEFSITAGDSSITIGTDGAIAISAPKITLTGEQSVAASAAQVQLSADEQLSMEGQVQASLKGAMVQIQAEGPLQAKGEPVMIN